MSENTPDIAVVLRYLESLQAQICDALEAQDGEAKFLRQEFARERGGVARPAVLEGGPVLERAAVNFFAQLRAGPARRRQRPAPRAGRSRLRSGLNLADYPPAQSLRADPPTRTSAASSPAARTPSPSGGLAAAST